MYQDLGRAIAYILSNLCYVTNMVKSTLNNAILLDE
jgi:hypothetical protein